VNLFTFCRFSRFFTAFSLLGWCLLSLGIMVSSPAFAGAFMLLERDLDLAGQTDLFLASYADQNDFQTNTNLTQLALPQPIAGGFSVGGITVDAFGGWHLLLERDLDLAGQTDLFLVSYANQNDFLTNTNLTQLALPQPIAGGFSVAGLHFMSAPEPPPSVPEPSTLLLLGVGPLMFAIAKRRRRTVIRGRVVDKEH
jgi:hypothetical protein